MRYFKAGIAVFLTGFLASCASNPCNGLYGKIGAGYNINTGSTIQNRNQENEHWKDDSPYTARIALETDCYKNVTVGLQHLSQWLTGWPVNNQDEVDRNEIYIDYKFKIL